MAPVKFEEHINDKLEQRAIKPSENSWNKLAERLEAQDHKKTNKGYWWIGIAASIVSIIVVSNSLLNSDVVPNENSTIQIVDGDEDTINNKNNKQINDIEIILNEDAKLAEIEKTELESEKQDQTKLNTQPKITEVKIEQISTSNIKSDNIRDERNALNKAEVRDKEFDVLETTNSINAYARNESKETSNKSENLDNEIDDLLSKAKADVSTKTANNKDKLKVNPKGLLDEIEFDLDQSFREKVFQKLKTSYKKVSTAVAHRND